MEVGKQGIVFSPLSPWVWSLHLVSHKHFLILKWAAQAIIKQTSHSCTFRGFMSLVKIVKLRKKLLVLSFWTAFLETPSLSQWQGTSGPSGGEVNKIIIHPQNPQIMYAIVSLPFSGVFKSTDGGNFWRALTNGLEFDAIESDSRWPLELAINISHVETLYVAINELSPSKPSFLYRSMNGGESWSRIKEDRIFAIYANQGKVFALSSSGLLFSSDAGNSWVLRNDSLSGDRRSNILTDDQEMLWIAGTRGLFRSADSGKTYQQLVFPEKGQIQAFDVAIVDSKKLIAASVSSGGGGYGSFYVSYDEGKTWLDRTATLPFEPNLRKYAIPYDVKISRYNIDHIFAGLSVGFYRTTDGGINWEQQNSGLILPRTITPSAPTYVPALAISSQKANLIIAGTGGDGIFRSTDEGLNWQFLSAPTGAVASLSASKNSSRVFAASEGGIYFFEENNWIPTTMLVGHILGGLNEVGVSPHNPGLALCGGQNSVFWAFLYKTLDAGSTWNLRMQTVGDGAFSKFLFDPIDTNRVYAAWTRGLMVSDDQGESWSRLPIPSGLYPVDMAISPLDNQTLYLLRRHGRVERSYDRGVTWMEIRPAIDSVHTAICIDPRNPNILYVGSFSLFKSENGGDQWMRMPFHKKVTDIAIDAETGELFVGTYNEGVWRSSDGGNTFAKMSDLPSGRILSLLFCVQNQRKMLFAGTRGVGAYCYDLGPTTGVATDRRLALDFHLAQNYPNPFNATTQITYVLPARGKVLVQVSNVLGQKVKTLVDGEEAAGLHTVMWDGADESGKPESTGLYLYTLSFRGARMVRKMVYLK